MAGVTVTDYTPAQQRVLDAAASAFSEFGFRGTSTRDIAARAGRSPAAVYVHYPSKEDLLFAVSRRGHEAALHASAQAVEGISAPAERLSALVRASTLWHLENARLARVVQHEFEALTGPHRSAIAALRRKTSDLVVDAIVAGNSSADFDVPDADVAGTARALLSLSIDLVRWYTPERNHNRGRASEIADLNVRLARRMVGA